MKTHNAKHCLILKKCCVFCGFILLQATAYGMSNNTFMAQLKDIDAQNKQAIISCNVLNKFEKELCAIKANGLRDNKKSSLQATYKPTIQNRYKLSMVTAGTNYSIGTKECEDANALDKATCRKDVEETYLLATANARKQRNKEKTDEQTKNKMTNLGDSQQQYKRNQTNIFNKTINVKS